MNPVEILLLMAGILGLLGVARMIIHMASDSWYEGRHAAVEDLPTWNCEAFHLIMNQPHPWYVVVDDKMSKWHC